MLIPVVFISYKFLFLKQIFSVTNSLMHCWHLLILFLEIFFNWYIKTVQNYGKPYDIMYTLENICIMKILTLPLAFITCFLREHWKYYLLAFQN